MLFSPKDRLVPEIGKAVFGKDRERSFKGVVACFEQLGQERLAKIWVVFFPLTSFGLRQRLGSNTRSNASRLILWSNLEFNFAKAKTKK